MFGRKFKFACLALTSCMFQFPFFLGCSREFVDVVVRNFTPTFGRSLGEALGTSLGTLPVLDAAGITALINQILMLAGGAGS